MKKSIPKKNCKRHILDLDHDDEDTTDGVPKQGSKKKEKKRQEKIIVMMNFWKGSMILKVG